MLFLSRGVFPRRTKSCDCCVMRWSRSRDTRHRWYGGGWRKTNTGSRRCRKTQSMATSTGCVYTGTLCVMSSCRILQGCHWSGKSQGMLCWVREICDFEKSQGNTGKSLESQGNLTFSCRTPQTRIHYA